MEEEKQSVNIDGNVFGTGCKQDPKDDRDYVYDDVVLGASPVDWEKGFDIEKELGIKIPIKNQGKSSSCVGQGTAYYLAILNAKEVGFYDEVSAKAIYSLIALAGGGAFIRSAMDLAVNWGSLPEKIISSYENGNPPSEQFMKEKGWKTPEMDRLAKVLQSKAYYTIRANKNMELFAQAIRDNLGVVGGASGSNNGTWSSNEPKPPTSPVWDHALYFGKYGIDSKGKWMATPNSWGYRNPDDLHPDGWQKLREDYFASNFMFNPWTLVDKPNININEPMIELIKADDNSTVWIKWANNTRSYIFDWDQFLELAPLLGKTKDDIKVISESELEGITKVKPVVVIK